MLQKILDSFESLVHTSAIEYFEEYDLDALFVALKGTDKI